VTFSYCIDSENRNIARNPAGGNSNNNIRRDNNNQSQQSSSNDQQQQAMYAATNNYQYTLADVPKLAEQAANMYAQNPTEKASYLQYYTDFYTKQISQVNIIGNA
jgi:RNA-binding protein 5/10